MDAHDLMWMRILNQLVSAMGDTMIVLLLVFLLKASGTGHRRLMLLGAIMFGSKTISLGFGARALYIHNHHFSVWLSCISSGIILAFAYYAFVTRDDILKTLRRSEAIDQIWNWRIANAQQVALNTNYIANKTLENVTKLSPH